MAPELLAVDDDDDENLPQLTTCTDVWSFAMTVLEMFTGRVPFCHLRSDAAVLFSLMKGAIPRRESYPEVTPEVWAVLQRCWNYEPAHRPPMHSLSLTLNVLAAAFWRNSVSETDPLLVLDALEKKETERSTPTLQKTEPEWGTLTPKRVESGSSVLLRSKTIRSFHNNGNTQSLNGHSKCDGCDRRKLRRRSFSDKGTVKLDDKCLSWWRPYPCRWPSCNAQFGLLRHCQEHEFSHVVNEIGIGLPSTHPPS
jgi:hypothetical protein